MNLYIEKPERVGRMGWHLRESCVLPCDSRKQPRETHLCSMYRLNVHHKDTGLSSALKSGSSWFLCYCFLRHHIVYELCAMFKVICLAQVFGIVIISNCWYFLELGSLFVMHQDFSKHNC